MRNVSTQWMNRYKHIYSIKMKLCHGRSVIKTGQVCLRAAHLSERSSCIFSVIVASNVSKEEI